jgi:hypothetical protein
MGFIHLQIEWNPWVGGYRPQIPVLSALYPQLNLLNPPPPPKKKFLVRHWGQSVSVCAVDCIEWPNCNKERLLLHHQIVVIFFVVAIPPRYFQRWSLNNDKLRVHDALLIYCLLSYHTTTCFVCISSPSSGGRMYVYMCGIPGKPADTHLRSIPSTISHIYKVRPKSFKTTVIKTQITY